MTDLLTVRTDRYNKKKYDKKYIRGDEDTWKVYIKS